MTITSDDRWDVETASAGGETFFDFDFEVRANEDVEIWEVDTSDVATKLTLTTDYTLSNLDEASGFRATLDGTQYPSGATQNHKFVAVGAQDLNRSSDLTQGGDFSAAGRNAEMDALWMALMELRRRADRTPELHVSDQGITTPIRLDVLAAGDFIRVNTDGDGMEGIAGGVVLSGSGAPADVGTGNDGDFYIDTANDNLYGPKTGGSWGSATSLVGPAGAQGPAGNDGADGDDGEAAVTTSTTSLAIGTGSKTAVLAADKPFQAGQYVKLSSAANVANYMRGTATSYTSGTKTLIVDVTDTGGSGTHADWNVSATGPGGGISAVVEDTTPELGGDLDVGGNTITSSSDGDIVIHPDGTGEIDLANTVTKQGVFEDYGIESAGPSSSSGTLTLDYSTGPDFAVTLTEDVTTLTITNWPASGTLGKITLQLTQDATGSRAFPDLSQAAYKTPGGGTFTVSSGANDVDELVLWSRDAGSTIYWLAVGQDFT